MIAIHLRSRSFSDRWIEYCENNSIPFKIVDCFSSDILDQLRDCRALMWHWAHSDFHAQLFARQLIASAREMGIVVFPDIDTCWHYDDKIGQKYLLEAIGAPLVPSHVFYDKKAALDWVAQTEFPKVWKLRGGAGSQNVRLVRSREEARRIVARSFGRGWRYDRFHPLRERVWHFRRDRTLGSFVNIGRGIARAAIPHETTKMSRVERGYVYFQDFIPDIDVELRLTVVGDRCFGFQRLARGEDFRASGSGIRDFDPGVISLHSVALAMKIAKQARLQCAAFDIIQREHDCAIIEISYGFPWRNCDPCHGYWDSNLEWHEAPVIPEHFMIDDLIQRLESREYA